MHMDLNFVIHFTGLFLPWHRTFVWGVENAMKTKCNYQGVQPYWDWSEDAADFEHATIFDDDPESGFGGWGNPADDYQITTGGLEDFWISYPDPHRIRRQYTPEADLTPGNLGYINVSFAKPSVDYMVDSFIGDFVGFQGYFESLQGPHPGPHIIMGGDMTGSCPNSASECVSGPKWTPNDPLFFMHHAMVDKLWYDWQKKHPSNFYAYSGGSVSEFGNVTLFAEFPNGSPPLLNFSTVLPNDGLLWKDLTVWDVMDTTCDLFCYVYE